MSKRTDLITALDNADIAYTIDETGGDHEHVTLTDHGLVICAQFGGRLDDEGWFLGDTDDREIWETDTDDVAPLLQAISDESQALAR